jgi:hypothetical protein
MDPACNSTFGVVTIRDLDIFTLSYFIVYLLKCYFIGDYLNILTTSGRGLMLSKAGIFH